MTIPSRTNDIALDIALARRLADAARAAILPYYRKPHGLEMKADSSPVTLADRAAEAAMRRILATERPHDGVIGEEYGADRPDRERLWVLDPIDGTRSFACGRPLFTTLIAVMIADDPVIGIIDQPVSDERWVGATGHPTTLNGRRTSTRACPALRGAGLATTSPHLFACKADHAAFLRVMQAVTGGADRQGPVYGGDAYNYALLASGHLDLVIESGLALYDLAALAPVVAGAGGAFTDWHGRAPGRNTDGTVIASGDPALAEVARALLEPSLLDPSPCPDPGSADASEIALMGPDPKTEPTA